MITIAIISSLIVATFANSPAEPAQGMSCSIDHLGYIKFIFPNVTENAKLYYKQRDKKTWKQVYGERPGEFKFTMQQLVNLYIHKMEMTSYEFKLSVTHGNKTTNTSNLYFSKSKPMIYEVNPWLTRDQIGMCSGGFGVKYLGHNESYDKVTLEWYVYPLDVHFMLTRKFTLSIRGPKANIIENIDCDYSDECRCEDDFCSYTRPSLQPCSEYRICVEAKNGYGVQQQSRRCRTVRTFCYPASTAKIAWQDVLLIILGLLISVIFFVLIFVRFRNQNSDPGSIENEIIIPRNSVSSADTILHNDNDYLYEYPTVLNMHEGNLLVDEKFSKSTLSDHFYTDGGVFVVQPS